MKTLYAFLPLFIGFLIPIQARINGKLFSVNQNALLTALISVMVSTLIISISYFSTGHTFTFGKAPWWAYLGGVCGAGFVILLAWTAEKVPMTQLMIGLLSGQMVMAIVLDLMRTGSISPRQIISSVLIVGAVMVKG